MLFITEDTQLTVITKLQGRDRKICKKEKSNPNILKLNVSNHLKTFKNVVSQLSNELNMIRENIRELTKSSETSRLGRKGHNELRERMQAREKAVVDRIESRVLQRFWHLLKMVKRMMEKALTISP